MFIFNNNNRYLYYIAIDLADLLFLHLESEDIKIKLEETPAL